MTDNIYLLVIIAMVGAALLVVSFILITIYNNNKLLKQKRKLQEIEINYQKELLYSVIDSQEKERQRIGMDLHDEVGSTLSSLRMLIEHYLGKIKDIPEASTFSTQSKSIIDSVISNVRNISHDLSPLAKGIYNFADVLEDLKDRVNLSGKIKMDLNVLSNDLSKLDTKSTVALYRVFTELVNNTIKHAQATHIELSIEGTYEKLSFNYKDNGIGIAFSSAFLKKGIGMKNIESRLRMIGANFVIDEQGQGFEMVILLNTV